MEFENNINEYIEGRNAVIEALRAGRAIDIVIASSCAVILYKGR